MLGQRDKLSDTLAVGIKKWYNPGREELRSTRKIIYMHLDFDPANPLLGNMAKLQKSLFAWLLIMVYFVITKFGNNPQTS